MFLCLFDTCIRYANLWWNEWIGRLSDHMECVFLQLFKYFHYSSIPTFHFVNFMFSQKYKKFKFITFIWVWEYYLDIDCVWLVRTRQDCVISKLFCWCTVYSSVDALKEPWVRDYLTPCYWQCTNKSDWKPDQKLNK